MVTREFPPESGGIGYYIYNLSKKLIEKGHKITIINRGNTHKTKKEFVDGIDLFNVTFFPLYPFHMPLHSFFVNSTFRSMEKEFNIVHFHSPVVPPIKTILPIVITVHTAMKSDSRYHEVVDPYSLVEKMQSLYFSPPVESQLLKLSNKITAVSPSVANELRDYYFENRKIEVVWNGVDEKKFSPINNQEKKPSYILFTGVLRARKGLFDLINCATIVNKKLPNTKFVICGAGPLLQKLQDQVRRLGLREQIIFTGRVSREKLVQLYQNATIQVVPSIYEGLPTVVLEGMACGLPVIVTDIGGSRDLISSGKNGFIVPVRSPEEMAEKILILMNDEPTRIRIGQNARLTILNNYTWDLIADNFIKLYESL